MFGYIKIYPEQLKMGEARAYRSVYCGLCHQIAKYSQFARMFLSFDMVFFTLLSAYDKHEIADLCVRNKCLKNIACPDPLVDYWAAMSIVIIYNKLLNDVKDGEIIKKIYVLDLEKAYRKAKEKYQVEEEIVACSLSEIEELENRKESDPEKLLEIFGRMMGSLIDAAPCGERSDSFRSVLRSIGETISKWLYALDFYDDLNKDIKKKQYNPLIEQMNTNGLSQNEVKESMKITIEKYVEELQRLCAYLPYEGFQDIVKNVLHEGVLHVTADVYRECHK